VNPADPLSIMIPNCTLSNPGQYSFHLDATYEKDGTKLTSYAEVVLLVNDTDFFTVIFQGNKTADINEDLTLTAEIAYAGECPLDTPTY
jgi:hypothetical protein